METLQKGENTLYCSQGREPHHTRDKHSGAVTPASEHRLPHEMSAQDQTFRRNLTFIDVENPRHTLKWNTF